MERERNEKWPYRVAPTRRDYAGMSRSANKLNTDTLFVSGNEWGFPDVAPAAGCFEPPAALIPYRGRKQEAVAGKSPAFIHFFLDDYYFESAWSKPGIMDAMALRFGGFLGPSFSVFSAYPRAMNIWNVYRNRWVCAYLQFRGIAVIPAVGWADSSTYDFCFAGLPKRDIVAISTVGTHAKENRQMFNDGFFAMLGAILPDTLLVYGERKPLAFEDYVPNVSYFPSEWQKKRMKIEGKGKR
jgi:hypothetical protein